MLTVVNFLRRPGDFYVASTPLKSNYVVPVQSSIVRVHHLLVLRQISLLNFGPSIGRGIVIICGHRFLLLRQIRWYFGPSIGRDLVAATRCSFVEIQSRISETLVVEINQVVLVFYNCVCGLNCN